VAQRFAVRFKPLGNPAASAAEKCHQIANIDLKALGMGQDVGVLAQR